MMTTREFIQHILLNAELDDPILIEVQIPENNERRFLSFEPAHVSRIDAGKPETLVECKPFKEDL